MTLGSEVACYERYTRGITAMPRQPQTSHATLEAFECLPSLREVKSSHSLMHKLRLSRKMLLEQYSDKPATPCDCLPLRAATDSLLTPRRPGILSESRQLPQLFSSAAAVGLQRCIQLSRCRFSLLGDEMHTAQLERLPVSWERAGRKLKLRMSCPSAEE